MRVDIGYLGKPGVTDVFKARVIFFYRLKELIPEVVEELHNEVFLGRQSLKDWAARHRLACPWVEEAVRASLAKWREDATWLERRIILPAGGPDFDTVTGALEQLKSPPRLTGLHIPLPEFNPIAWSQAEYIRLVQDIAGDVARAYSEAVLSQYGKEGWTQPPVKRKRTGNNPYLHFDWLIRYQVEGCSYSKLAKEYLEDRLLVSTVRDSVKKTAELIGLPLRTQSPGRPRKE